MRFEMIDDPQTNPPPARDIRRIMDGSDTSARAAMLRAATACAEPFYATAMRLRNALYDRRIFRTTSLGKPAISIGNITTGGTGKTPVVQWLAKRLLGANHHPAVLLRGYKRNAAGISDEQSLLQAALGEIPVLADPDRIAGARMALRKFPRTSVFLLDDAMQHRRAARQFELILIHAGEPFGFGHVLPRGMLREPLDGLRRASAFLITHADEASQRDLAEIEAVLHEHQPAAPIFRCDHTIADFRASDPRGAEPRAGQTPIDRDSSIPSLLGRRYLAFCGIGSPESFFQKLQSSDGDCAGTRAFADHHDYSVSDLTALQQLARDTSAEILITSEKDWVKLAPLARNLPGHLPIWRASLALKFWPGQEDALLDLIDAVIKGSPLYDRR
jgi:tetraacyldisaccharide 4'-kinase